MLYLLSHGLIEACPASLTTVVLMAGTNNIEKASVEHVAEGVRNLIAVMLDKRQSLRFVLFGILPRDSTVKSLSNDALAEKIRALNAKLAEIPESLPCVAYKDPTTLFLWNERKNADYYDDHVHLNHKGYLIFAQEIITAVEEVS
jgi:lysophospholipase L1-like esterase